MTPTKQHHLHALLLLLICSYSIDAAAKHNAAVPCHPDQASSLLQLKQSFIDVDASLASWRAGSDCCHWEGVACDVSSGRVVSLDLGGYNLVSRRLDPAIFNLTSLRNLSLAYNDFGAANLPSYGFEHLTNIIHLNFSLTNFFGQIPIGIARLKNLVTLDFSDNYGLYMQEPNFQTFMANLSYLRELRLDGVDISTSGSNWSIVLADSVPQLQILSLFLCGMSGPIHHSFSRLRSLTIIDLGNNWGLTGKVPDFFAEFSSLRILDISGCSFRGQIPTKIILMKSLRVLDLSRSPNISVCLPDFPLGNDLETLNLAGTTVSCDIQPSLTNLKS
ncbi:receptor-like protein 6 [Triticum aestivum]|uniref:receptor-like protein 6 n=1 Tax=Triticum aestivum TaxID=4565 RepID=UPI001D0188F4|nr:receptor-like protein 6 [Triticum aestivum]